MMLLLSHHANEGEASGLFISLDIQEQDVTIVSPLETMGAFEAGLKLRLRTKQPFSQGLRSVHGDGT